MSSFSDVAILRHLGVTIADLDAAGYALKMMVNLKIIQTFGGADTEFEDF